MRVSLGLYIASKACSAVFSMSPIDALPCGLPVTEEVVAEAAVEAAAAATAAALFMALSRGGIEMVTVRPAINKPSITRFYYFIFLVHGSRCENALT